MADVEANVNINVEGAGSLEEAAGAAEALAEALEEAGAAADEAGAEVSAAGDESAASLAAAKEEAGGLRDKLAEAGITADASAGSLTGLKAAADDSAAATRALRREQEQLSAADRDAGSSTGEVRQMMQTRTELAEAARQAQEEMGRIGADREGGAGTADLEALQREMGLFRGEEDDAAKASERFGSALRLDVAHAADEAANSLRDGTEAVEKTKADLADAEQYINRSGDAILGWAQKSEQANDAADNWFDTLGRAGGGSRSLGTLAGAAEEADSAFSDFAETGQPAQFILRDLSAGADDAGAAMGDAGLAAADTGGIIGSIAMPLSDAGDAFGVFGQAGEKIKGLGMPVLIGGIASAAETVLPVVGSLAAGFGAWGALAFPALDKVEQGLTSVSAAQTKYSAAAQLQKNDPTATNAKAAAKDLLALHNAYKSLPAGVAPAVSAVEQFKRAWTQAGQKSGIANDALKDIPKLVDSAKGLIPSVTKLAQATNPVINSMITDFGKFEKSKGFSQFIGNIASQIGPASSALHQLGGALGGVISQMFSKSNMKAGDSLISSFAGLTKAMSPGVLDTLKQGAQILTGVNKTLSDWAKPGGALNNAGKHWDQTVGIGKDVVNWGRDAAKAVSDVFKVRPSGNGLIPSVDWGKAFANFKIPAKDSSVKLKVSADTTSAESEMKNLRDSAGKGGDVKLKVSADTSAAKSAVSAVTKAGKGDDVKIKVTADTAAAKSALESLSRVKLADAKMSVAVSGAGAASSDLRSVSSAGSAMGSGVAAGAGHATSATSAMAGSMRGTVAPIPGAFHGIGSAAGAGMAAGIAASTGAAVAAARNMASAVEAAAKVQLGVASPSTVFKKIGADTVAGYILGLEGGKSAVETAMNDALAVKPFKDGTITSEIAAITAELNKAVKAGKINPAERSDYVDMLTSDNKQLQALASRRAQLESQITKADQLAASVQSAAVQAASLTTVAGETGPGMTAAAQAAGGTDLSGNPIAQYGTIQQGLQANLKSIQTFRQQIIKLKKDGLDKEGIQELLAAGVQQGSATASQILAGGPAAVKQIAQLDNSIGLASKKLGITGGNAAYESGSQIGGQLAAGLKASLATVNTEMADISKNLVVGIMTALGDSSKDIKAALAKLDKELGLPTGASGGSGGKAGGKSTITPPHIIEQPKPKGTFDQPGPIRPTPPPTVVHPVAAAYMSGASGGSSQPIVITSNITLTVDGQTLSRVVQTKTVARGRRNVGSGLVLPGRGT